MGALSVNILLDIVNALLIGNTEWFITCVSHDSGNGCFSTVITVCE